MSIKLDEYERKKIRGCIENIKDKINAIENEINTENSFKSYIMEKIEPVCWDANYIKSICKDDGNE